MQYMYILGNRNAQGFYKARYMDLTVVSLGSSGRKQRATNCASSCHRPLSIVLCKSR